MWRIDVAVRRIPLATRPQHFLYDERMKPEALVSISVAVMFAGIFLSALGAFGTYYFRGRTEMAHRPPPPVTLKADAPKLAERDTVREAWLASIVDPVAAPDDKPPAPPHAAPEPEVALPPVGELLVEKPRMETPPVAPPPIAVKPAPANPPAAIPEKPAPAKPVRVHLSGLGLAPWQLEKLLLRLRAVPHGTITIQAPEGVEEALHFADALKEAFVAADWTVVGVNVVKAPREPAGVTLSSATFPPPVEVTTVFSALVTAGIKLSTDLDPSQGKQHAVLYIGSRP